MLQSFYKDDLMEAGCDEAGRGCLAGPVVAAAVILPKDFFDPDLNDSKQMTALQRERLEKVIKKEALCWKIGVVDNEEIDRINILRASFKAMHLAIRKMPLKPGLLLIDGNRFAKFRGIPHTCIVQGDALFASIAAASVLAKTYRDRLMKKLHREFPAYKWNRNKGYATEEHRNALREFGECKYHRKSFRLIYENGQLDMFDDAMADEVMGGNIWPEKPQQA